MARVKSNGRSTAQLAPNPANPRKITPRQLEVLKASLIEFGDLSGVIYNVDTGMLVGGHQRLKVLTNAPITITQRFPKPTKRGTVAEGYVTFKGERYPYREVRWSVQQQTAAMIAANKHGGDWNFEGLSDLLLELDSENFNLDLTGFSAEELEEMIQHISPNVGDELPATPFSAEQLAALPSHVRLVQLFFDGDTLPIFMARITALRARFNKTNITDTVFAAVEECYANSGIQTANGEAPVETGLPSTTGEAT